MNKILGRLIGLFLICGLISAMGLNPGGCIAADLGPTITMGTPLVKMSDKATVVIMGTGFKPGQYIRIIFTTSDGQDADIGYALKPEPKADNTGTWGTTWSAGRFVKKEMITGGVYKISVADDDFNTIAQAPVFFQKPEKKAKEK